MPVIPTVTRLRQEDCEFEASLEYIVSSWPGWTTTGDPFLKKLTKQNTPKPIDKAWRYSSVVENMLS
jgi:hypothetical protein